MSSENRFEMLGVPNAVTTFYKAVYKCVYNNNNNYLTLSMIVYDTVFLFVMELLLYK